MKSAATIGLLLFLATSPTAAEDVKPAVNAAFTVYTSILETEAIIDMCRNTDTADAASYDGVYEQYEDEISQTVIRIGLLVGQEFRRAGVDERGIWKALDALSNLALQTSERMARLDPQRFVLECKALPTAILTKTKPFEPIATKFPQEIEIIEAALKKKA